MRGEIESKTWATVDPWWDEFVKTYPVTQTAGSTRSLDERWTAGLWSEINPWWDAYVETRSFERISKNTAALDRRWRDGEWATVDPWWGSYAAARRATAIELRDALEELEHVWNASKSRFDADPLTVDWTDRRDTRGPLRPNQEENWSQWLAHLLRSAPEEFLGEFFGDRFARSPTAVRREVHLPDPAGTDRYADILVLYGDRGISIEVKKGDEHYRKTTHTAGLLEQQLDYDWHHILLLPKYKEPVLRTSFGDRYRVPESGHAKLCSDQSAPITVRYWRDVSKAIRTVLWDRSGEPHWDASAYLFCTLVEQQLVRLSPYPVVEKLATTDDVAHASQPLSVETGEVDEQLRYLRDVSGGQYE